MNKYDSYKDSGIEWIGEIPSHWDFRRLKYCAESNPSNIDKKSKDDEETVFLCNYLDVYYNEFISSELTFMQATASSAQIEKFKLEKGDVLATKDSESPDDIAVPALVIEDLPDVVCGYHLNHIKPFSIKGEYLFRLFQSPFFKSYFEVSANGVTRYGIGAEKFANVNILLPPPSEQATIASYLDRKTAEIDELIADKKRLLELYEEEKTALINQAVTKGLDPKAPKKDSGIEWLGEIPEHWGVLRLRYLGNCQNGISKGGDYFGKGFPFVSYSDVYKNDTIPNEVIGLVESSESERKSYSVDEGDVFFTRTSETIEEIGIASSCLKSIPDAVFAGFLIRFRPTSKKLSKEFSRFYFRAQILRKYFVKEMNLVTRASLSQELLKKLPVLLPPLEEQYTIAHHIETECSRIDTQVERTKKLIELLTEYRTALISEVVTGKVKVCTTDFYDYMMDCDS